jgi:protein-L-isoaspartate(D-aspartate) O-methyltransferase
MDYQKFLTSLAESSQKTYERLGTPLSKPVLEAFYHHPRHLFVPRFRNSGEKKWTTLTEENSATVLPQIYEDHPLILWGTEEDFSKKSGMAQVSTISQPSFVLRMLDLLKIEEGQTVFELGTASGWNAALISYLVGNSGKVITVEIISELAESAAIRLKKMGIENITCISGDAALQSGSEQLDRVMYTAGAFDFPKKLFHQIKLGALVLFVYKNKGGSDILYLLKMQDGYLESIYSQTCAFVPVTGASHVKEMEEKDLEEFLVSKKIPLKGDSKKFFWGVGNKSHFYWQTAALRSYLSLFEKYEAFTDSFGWVEKNSLCVAKAEEMISYGGEAASESLKAKIKEWVEIGMPTLTSMNFRIYVDAPKRKANGFCWLSKRNESFFEWELS